MCKTHTVEDREISMDFRGKSFCRNDVTFLLSWIYNQLSHVLDVLPHGWLNNMQVLCTLYERHTCWMCMRSEAAQPMPKKTPGYFGHSFKKYFWGVLLVVVSLIPNISLQHKQNDRFLSPKFVYFNVNYISIITYVCLFVWIIYIHKRNYRQKTQLSTYNAKALQYPWKIISK